MRIKIRRLCKRGGQNKRGICNVLSPGIPILAPGERITREIIDYTRYAKDKGCIVTGTEDITLGSIKVVEI